jgi:polysaccharide export outer membrane protein
MVPRYGGDDQVEMAAMLRRLTVGCALLLLAGCNAIPRSGPGAEQLTNQTADLAGFTMITVTADNVANYRLQSKEDMAGTGGIPGAPRVRLSPGDVLSIHISESKPNGLFAPLAGGGTPFDGVRVNYDGTITLPYAGRIKVAGLDTQKVEEVIRARLAGITFEPQVFVAVVADRGSSVLVSGDVKVPGRFSLLDGPLTLIDAINRAGGSVRPAYQEDVVVRRGKQVVRIPLADILDGRNNQLNPGDEVIVEPNLRVFNALGAVSHRGQIDFSKRDPSLLDCLSIVGGLDNAQSSNTGVYLFRLREPHAYKDANGGWQQGPVIFHFDMSRPETMFLAQAFAMAPDDTIYVTNATSVEVMRSLQPIALTLTTIRAGSSTSVALSNLSNVVP